MWLFTTSTIYKERMKNVTQFICLHENNDVIDLYDNVSYSARNTDKRFFFEKNPIYRPSRYGILNVKQPSL